VYRVKVDRHASNGWTRIDHANPDAADAVSSYGNILPPPPPDRDIGKIGDQSNRILGESKSRSNGFRELDVDRNWIVVGRDPPVADLVAVVGADKGVQRNLLTERNIP